MFSDKEKCFRIIRVYKKCYDLDDICRNVKTLETVFKRSCLAVSVSSGVPSS